MATPAHVLRIPRSDEAGSFVLARVTPSETKTTQPLDVRIVATEGEAPYVLSMRHDRVDKLRAANAQCTPDEWVRILRFLLLGDGSVEHIDATATVTPEASVSITVRKRVQNITQRLGVLALAYDADEGIELFDWCGEAATRQADTHTRLMAATTTQAALQASVDDLKAQLDEFLRAKDADETAMLEKFCLLLNEKKVKIRVQQKLLAARSADTTQAAVDVADDVAAIKAEEESEVEVGLSRKAAGPSRKAAGPSRKAPTRGGRGGRLGTLGAANKQEKEKEKGKTAKRGAKRTATAASVSDDDSDSDSDGFEKPQRGSRGKGKAVAAPAGSIDLDSDTDSDSDAQSTDNGDASAKDNDEDDDEAGAEPMDEDTADRASAPITAAPVPAEIEAPPPRRVLAFGKPRTSATPTPTAPTAPTAAVPSKTAPKTAPPAQGSDSETDDEL